VNLSKLVIISSAAAALAVPAAALASHGQGKPADPGSPAQSAGKPASPGSQGKGRCRKPTVNEGYVVSGTYGTAGLFSPTAPNADGSYTGTVSFTVTHINHHAMGAKPPFSFTDARVTFDSPTATAPAATDSVRVIGKIAVAKKGCTSTSAGMVTINKIMFSTKTP
jgi:hypothetical protein